MISRNSFSMKDSFIFRFRPKPFPHRGIVIGKLTAMKKKFIASQFIWVSSLLIVSACHAQKKDFRYDLRNPEKIELPKEVNQVSGLAMAADGKHVYAIDDDHGDLFRISLKKDPSIDKYTFGKSRDFEDIAILNDRVFVLESSGRIVHFALKDPIDHTSAAEVNIKGKAEFESLYKDPLNNRLVMLCKDCNMDGKRENSAFAFDLETLQFDDTPSLKLKTESLEQVYGKKIGQFKPSAANVHPQTKDVYILSSINKLLVVADAQFRVKQVVALDEKLFPMPEGLCFSSSGDLLISNEATKGKKADILIFRQI